MVISRGNLQALVPFYHLLLRLLASPALLILSLGEEREEGGRREGRGREGGKRGGKREGGRREGGWRKGSIII